MYVLTQPLNHERGKAGCTGKSLAHKMTNTLSRVTFFPGHITCNALVEQGNTHYVNLCQSAFIYIPQSSPSTHSFLRTPWGGEVEVLSMSSPNASQNCEVWTLVPHVYLNLTANTSIVSISPAIPIPIDFTSFFYFPYTSDNVLTFSQWLQQRTRNPILVNPLYLILGMQPSLFLITTSR